MVSPDLNRIISLVHVIRWSKTLLKPKYFNTSFLQVLTIRINRPQQINGEWLQAIFDPLNSWNIDFSNLCFVNHDERLKRMQISSSDMFAK